MLGCIIPMSALIPYVEADVPSATGSRLAYWHFQDSGGNMWANTNPDDADDSGTTERQETLYTPTNVGYGFAVRATMDDDSLLDEALYFEDNGQIHGKAWVELSAGIGTDLPTEITFYVENVDGGGTTLNTWLTTPPVSYRDDGKYTFYIDIDGAVVPAGNQLVLGINFEAQTGITTITFHTSDESWFNLPLVEGSDGDGGDGDGGKSEHIYVINIVLGVPPSNVYATC